MLRSSTLNSGSHDQTCAYRFPSMDVGNPVLAEMSRASGARNTLQSNKDNAIARTATNPATETTVHLKITCLRRNSCMDDHPRSRKLRLIIRQLWSEHSRMRPNEGLRYRR